MDTDTSTNTITNTSNGNSTSTSTGTRETSIYSPNHPNKQGCLLRGNPPNLLFNKECGWWTILFLRGKHYTPRLHKPRNILKQIESGLPTPFEVHSPDLPVRPFTSRALLISHGVFRVLEGEWGSEYRDYYGGIYGNHIGMIRRIHSPTLPSAPVRSSTFRSRSEQSRIED